MTFLDKAKRGLSRAKGRAGALAGQHGDKIDQAIDKGGSYLNQRTGGKYSDKIAKAGDSTKSAATRLADQHREAEQATSSQNAPEEPASWVDPLRRVHPTEPTDSPDTLGPDSKG